MTDTWRRIDVSYEVELHFVQNGWTAHDWNTLDDELFAEDFDSTTLANGFYQVREWLRHPPAFENPVTPTLVRETITAFGVQAVFALNGYAAGASPEFVAAFLVRHPEGNPEVGWGYAQRAHLDGPSAAGWVLTGLLNQDLTEDGHTTGLQVIRHIRVWTAAFGPTAYLWVLAGFDLGEATTLVTDQGPVSEERLRVMAALNGADLPTS